MVTIQLRVRGRMGIPRVVKYFYFSSPQFCTQQRKVWLMVSYPPGVHFFWWHKIDISRKPLFSRDEKTLSRLFFQQKPSFTTQVHSTTMASGSKVVEHTTKVGLISLRSPWGQTLTRHMPNKGGKISFSAFDQFLTGKLHRTTGPRIVGDGYPVVTCGVVTMRTQPLIPPPSPSFYHFLGQRPTERQKNTPF